LGSFRKKRRRLFLPLLLWRLSKAHTWSARAEKLGSFREKNRSRSFLPLLLWRLSKTQTWSATVLVDELHAGGVKTRFDRLTSSAFSRARKSCGRLREQIGQRK
jgi:hypothetical protein